MGCGIARWVWKHPKLETFGPGFYPQGPRMTAQQGTLNDTTVGSAVWPLVKDRDSRGAPNDLLDV